MADIWQSTPPDEEGQWWMLCAELDGVSELVNIQHHRGELYAMDCLIGTIPLKHYHEGLTNCQWQRFQD